MYHIKIVRDVTFFGVQLSTLWDAYTVHRQRTELLRRVVYIYFYCMELLDVILKIILTPFTKVEKCIRFVYLSDHLSVCLFMHALILVNFFEFLEIYKCYLCLIQHVSYWKCLTRTYNVYTETHKRIPTYYDQWAKTFKSAF